MGDAQEMQEYMEDLGLGLEDAIDYFDAQNHEHYDGEVKSMSMDEYKAYNDIAKWYREQLAEEMEEDYYFSFIKSSDNWESFIIICKDSSLMLFEHDAEFSQEVSVRQAVAKIDHSEVDALLEKIEWADEARSNS